MLSDWTFLLNGIYMVLYGLEDTEKFSECILQGDIMKFGKKMITGSSLLMVLGVLFAATILVSAAVVVLSATKSNGLQPVGDYPVRLTLTTGQDYQTFMRHTLT
jgi:hypothetical protein